MSENLSRRALLVSGGVVAVGTVAVLAGCSNGGTPSGSATDAFAQLSDFEVGESRNFTVNGTDLVVTRVSDTEVVAFDAECTHEGCRTGARDGVIFCDCHSAEFEPTTGEPISGPAQSALASIPVVVRDGGVFFAS
ncbi:MAG: Rieske (2Fe-2S) protein [Microbacteriaceae bacterium]